ncbi:MAG: methyl-accepting chemotaxis protein [Pseudomonadota bacterium]
MDPIKAPLKIVSALLFPLLPVFSLLLWVSEESSVALKWAVGIVVFVAIFAFFWIYIKHIVLRPLFDLNSALRRILASSDITVRAHNRPNHLGCTTPEDFNQLMDRVVRMINGSQISIGRVYDMAVQFTTDAGLIADSSVSQTQSASSIRSEVEALYEHIASVAQHAEATEQQSTWTRDQSTEGGKVVDSAAEAMKEIVNSFQASTEMLNLLKENTEEVSGFAGEIANISEQTNMLALNAAIEAARAGEQGRGFAVVADEVRNLAVRTGDATSHISQIINTIQEQTSGVILSMEATSQAVTGGSAVLIKASDSLAQINNNMDRMLEMIAEISAAGHHQKNSSQLIGEKIEAIVDSAQNNNLVISQTANGARELLHLAQQVKESSSEFTVQKDELNIIMETINEVRANAILAANATSNGVAKEHVEKVGQLDAQFDDVWKNFCKRPLSDSQKQLARTFSDKWQRLIQVRNITLKHASSSEFEQAKENVVKNAAPKYKVAREALLELEMSMQTSARK